MSEAQIAYELKTLKEQFAELEARTNEKDEAIKASLVEMSELKELVNQALINIKSTIETLVEHIGQLDADKDAYLDEFLAELNKIKTDTVKSIHTRVDAIIKLAEDKQQEEAEA
ncbi:hypothetical protein [Vibrio metschnikovii]|uniref:hypothetical protein n=1 Tax=Vibrio metschnikovii TaxID=28172 RepID=UPI001C300FE3|nr:hypothetical protein [Vibrio metschnikovii]